MILIKASDSDGILNMDYKIEDDGRILCRGRLLERWVPSVFDTINNLKRMKTNLLTPNDKVGRYILGSYYHIENTKHPSDVF
jgi:hypothetical protein